MEGFENKNDKQRKFNEIRGRIKELNGGEKYCSITLEVGHENPRMVNLIIKKTAFDKAVSLYKVDDNVSITFFVVSRHKHGRWYTMANVLDINSED
jgi:hypothetical protein